MKIWGMSAEEFIALLDESFTAIKRSSRKTEAQHYARTRILASDLEKALERLRGAAQLNDAPQEKLCVECS